MQFSAVTLALAFGSANAFMGQPLNTRSARSAAVKMTTQEELAELAESNRDALLQPTWHIPSPHVISYARVWGDLDRIQSDMLLAQLARVLVLSSPCRLAFALQRPAAATGVHSIRARAPLFMTGGAASTGPDQQILRIAYDASSKRELDEEYEINNLLFSGMVRSMRDHA